MSIRPVDLGGMIQRTEDVHVIKHQEDAKPQIDQANISQTIDQRDSDLVHTVMGQEASAKTKNDADAKEEGRGSYVPGRRGSVKKKPAGKVTPKGATGGFDIKI